MAADLAAAAAGQGGDGVADRHRLIMVVLAIAAPGVRRDHPPPAEHRVPEHRRERGGQPGAAQVPPASGSAPTAPAATCSSGSSTARASRCSSASSPPRIGTVAGVSVGPDRRVLRRVRRHGAGPVHRRGARVPLHRARARARGGARPEPDRDHRASSRSSPGPPSPGSSAARPCRSRRRSTSRRPGRWAPGRSGSCSSTSCPTCWRRCWCSPRLYIPTAVVFEATLSYLGLGIQPPTASWGNILADAQNFYQVAWWYVVFPAAALLITTLAFNLLGDGITGRDGPAHRAGLARAGRSAGQAPQAGRRDRRRTRRVPRGVPGPPAGGN